MSKAKTPEAKKENRIINYLRDLTGIYNQEKYREINGKMYPYAPPYRNFADDYKKCKIIVIEGPRVNGRRQYKIDEVRSITEDKNGTPAIGVGNDNGIGINRRVAK